MNNEEKILALLEKHGEILEGIHKRLGNMDERLDSVDERLDHVDKRLDHVDERLDNVEALSQRTAVLLETDYADKLQLLFDGHTAMMQKLDDLAPRSRVDELEDDVAMMKDVIKLMRQEIAELKKAQ